MPCFEDPPQEDDFLISTPAPRYIVLPEALHSFYEKGPFQRCTVCSRNLGDGCLHEIQKVFRGQEVVFEMALCQPCGEGLCKELSEEFMKAMKGFFLSNFKPSKKTQQCNFCGFPRLLASGYALIGACRNGLLLVPAIVLCDRCAENLHAQLSEKTRQAQDDFIKNHFPGVPPDLDLNPTFYGAF